MLEVDDCFTRKFGLPTRNVAKVKSWNFGPNASVVLQVDQPKDESYALLWLPYPEDGRVVPETANEYPGEAGRHSGTYAAKGLERGKPALKITVCSITELDNVVDYLQTAISALPLPVLETLPSSTPEAQTSVARDAFFKVDASSMPAAKAVKPRREAIPRVVQREVWQRDGGECVECKTKEKLCFDHILPFSRGGGNTVRNIQILCEGCNLAKGNRI